MTLTASDYDMALYFLKDKGDITRWCDWEEKREALCLAVPELSDWLLMERMVRSLKTAMMVKLEDRLATEQEEDRFGELMIIPTSMPEHLAKATGSQP
jgi:hypothetical protein